MKIEEASMTLTRLIANSSTWCLPNSSFLK